MTWTTFCNIFLFTSQSWDPKVRRVSLNEWELNRKLAHQNTSRLPNNRKRPCKLWALWQRRERALILTPWLKTFYCALQLTIELASLALKKQMLWVGRGLSPCQQIPLTMVHLEGKKKKKSICATVRYHKLRSLLPVCILSLSSAGTNRHEGLRRTWERLCLVSCLCMFILFTEGFD